jgi:hypothetical protein
MIASEIRFADDKSRIRAIPLFMLTFKLISVGLIASGQLACV